MTYCTISVLVKRPELPAICCLQGPEEVVQRLGRLYGAPMISRGDLNSFLVSPKKGCFMGLCPLVN